MVLGYLGLLFADTFQAVLSLRFLAGVLGHGIAFSLGTALLVAHHIQIERLPLVS